MRCSPPFPENKNDKVSLWHTEDLHEGQEGMMTTQRRFPLPN
jgi:hypothetical protein